MEDWIVRLDDFLKMTGKEVLDNAGSISHKKAIEKAHAEYEKYKQEDKNALSKVEKDFIKKIESASKRLKDNNK